MFRTLSFHKKLYLVTITVVLATIVFLSVTMSMMTKRGYVQRGRAALDNVARTLSETVTLQDNLATKKIASDLDIMKTQFELSGFPIPEVLMDVEMPLTNQATGRTENGVFPAFKLGSRYLHEDDSLVKKVSGLTGVACSVLQLDKGRLIRVSTTVKNADGTSAQGTYIPEDSPLYKALMDGKAVTGRARVADGWAIASYSVIRAIGDNVIGALEVARPVVTPEFADFVRNVTVGGSGGSFAFDAAGNLVAPPRDAARDEARTVLAAFAENKATGSFSLPQADGENLETVVQYFEPWGLYFATCVSTTDLMAGVDAQLLKSALLSAVVPLVLSLLLIWLMSRQIVAPMARLAGLAEEVAAGNFDYTIDYAANDAIGQTVGAMKTMVADLKNQLGFAKGVLDGVVVPCAVVDLDNRITHVNQTALDVLNRSGAPRDYHGSTLNEFAFRDASRETLTQQAMREKRQLEWEICLPREDTCDESHLRVVATPVYDLDDALIGAMTIWVDLTKEKANQARVEAQRNAIAEAAREADRISRDVTTAAEELTMQIEHSSRGAEEQTSRASEASTAMEQMNASLVEVARNAQSATELSSQAMGKASQGESVVQNSIAVMRRVSEQASSLQTDMLELGKHAEGIGTIMNVISDIADQTNLLALNAAIEAARAGDAGRGFAVVADEVRKLAEKTMDATREVGNSIGLIQNSIRGNIGKTEEANASLSECNELVLGSGTALKEIVAIVTSSADQVGGIASATTEQRSASEQITKATEDIDRIAEANAQAMRESRTAINELNRLSNELMSTIERMQL